MSYCRWSSDWGECDVYVYEDVSGGWTTHVAGRRAKHRVPDEIRAIVEGASPEEWAEKYLEAREAEREWKKTFPHELWPTVKTDGSPGEDFVAWADSEYLDLQEIGSEAGESYNDPTPGDCADRLEALRAKGFNLPQYAIDALREEDEQNEA